MGSTKCKGVSLQDVLQLNRNKLPKPQGFELLTRVIKDTTNEIYNNIRYTKIQDIQGEIKISHPRAKHAPSSTYSTWTAFTGIYPLKHLRMKQVMPPQVGYSSTCLSTPQK